MADDPDGERALRMASNTRKRQEAGNDGAKAWAEHLAGTDVVQAKIAKLRALRKVKEEAEKANPPAAKTATARRRARRPAAS